MRYSLEGLDANTLGDVEALRMKRIGIARRKTQLVAELSEKGPQKERYLKHKELEALGREMEVVEKRLEELTGVEKGRIFGPPIPPTPRRSDRTQQKGDHQWIEVYEGGAPGLGKRS